MYLRSVLGAARRYVLCSAFRNTAPFNTTEAIVSFTFDDFPRSAYLAGGNILEQFGARGTYYVAPALMGTTDHLGEQFLAQDIYTLLEKGHEVGTQTYSHLSSRREAHSYFCADVRRGLSAVRELTGRQCSNFAYPYGHVTLRTKKDLAHDFASCRSIVPGFNGPQLDLSMLRSNRIYGDIGQSAKLELLIDANLKRRSWLIFYTHDVRPSPSPYGCTPELFQSAVAYALRTGCRILTVQQVLTQLGLQTHEPHC